jgi:excisionase family DNA binding protein
MFWRVIMTDRWLSVEEIGEHLGVSKDTVYAWIAKRNMPAHKVGRLWKFQKVEVDGWVKAGGANDGDEASQDRGDA